MTAKNDGGQAFPVAADGAYIPDCNDPSNPPAREFPGHPGMSLRDWFAGQALAGLCAAQSEGGQWQSVPNYAAAQAYEHADSMLAERDK